MSADIHAYYRILYLLVICCIVTCKDYHMELGEVNIPAEHLPYYTRGHSSSTVASVEDQVCYEKGSCQNKDASFKKKPCWGYEEDCKKEDRYSNPTCTIHHSLWATSLEHQRDIFFEQGDFGYIKKFKDQMMDICLPKQSGDSSLTCSKNLVFCQSTNLFLDLRRLNAQETTNRYREDVLQQGEVGGHCQLNKNLLKGQGENKSPLQSWYAELEYFTELPFKPLDDSKCDVVIERPTILIKLDAGVSMFHHFCDFINLYSSQHLNGSISTDINIVMWDTSAMHYHDFFEATWKAFTRHPILRLVQFDGKKVCFKNAVFSLLARMVFGLYYNMPLVPECMGSGLFKAFSHHIIHRLGIKQSTQNAMRITLLVRRTKYRRILNEKELAAAIRSVPVFELQVVDYNHNMPFLQQLNNTHNTDIFVGMHGSGLTHILFLPDWAVVFELYNTEDPDCYRDLAYLRGVTYMTWENRDQLFQEDEGHHPTLGAHAKFTNYAFNVDEFMRLISKAAELVKEKQKLLGF